MFGQPIFKLVFPLFGAISMSRADLGHSTHNVKTLDVLHMFVDV